MDTIIIGKGGREHALAMACRETSNDLFFADANAGMEQVGTNLGVDTINETAELASDLQVGLAIIGPEDFLAQGMADALRYRGIPTLGFGGQAAQLESSKAFAERFMEESGIVRPPTVVEDDMEAALKRAEERESSEYVLKADGLAAGKGVFSPEDEEDAKQKIQGMMSGELFGVAGRRVLFQDRYSGEEVSMMALFDGRRAKVLFLAQDYKRLLDGDEGPNTGGMGSYAPVPPEVASDGQLDQMYLALEKTIHGLANRGIKDPGVIYIGFMLADQLGGDPAVLEYNVRFGDPETQAGLTLLQDSGEDVHELIYRTATGDLGHYGTDRIDVGDVRRQGRAALTVCLAAPGYPGAPVRGEPIHGLDHEYPDVTIHHGGTRLDKAGKVLTDGGRVLYVTGLGDSLAEAARTAYVAIGEDGINFEDMRLRKDLGNRAIEALNQ